MIGVTTHVSTPIAAAKWLTEVQAEITKSHEATACRVSSHDCNGTCFTQTGQASTPSSRCKEMNSASASFTASNINS